MHTISFSESAPRIRVYLFGLFSVQRQEADGAWREIASEEWSGNLYARALLKLLLCSPQRAAERGTLLTRIWPSAENDTSLQKLLTNAAYSLREALQDQGCLLKKVGTRGNSSYELADQTLIWSDVDACEAILRTIDSLPPEAPGLLALLQEAARYFARGPFLAQDEALWCYGRRAELARKAYRCRVQLAEVWTRQGQFGQAEEIYNALLAENPSAEEVLERLMRLYHRQGLPHLAWRCYQDTRTLLEKDGSLPFSSSIEALARQLRHASLPATPEPVGAYASASTLSFAENLLEEEPVQESRRLNMDQNRRTLLQNAMGFVGTTMLPISSHAAYPQLLERLAHALKKPSSIDSTTLHLLSQRTTNYWRITYDRAMPSGALLSRVAEHLQKLTLLLEGSLSPDTRDRLSSITSRTALLAGALFFELGDYEESRAYYHLAMSAAQETQDSDQQALILGWTTFSWTYADQPREALTYAQGGRAAAKQGDDIFLQSWLAAIEAEIQAHLQERGACLQALSQAEKIEAAPHQDNRYVLYHHFDDSLLNGYRGACFKQLYDATDTQSRHFLQQAQQALLEAVAQRRRSNNLVDLSWTLVQQQEIEEACQRAGEALVFIQQKQSITSFRRLLAVRHDLAPWAETAAVKGLDERMNALRLQYQIR